MTHKLLEKDDALPSYHQAFHPNHREARFATPLPTIFRRVASPAVSRRQQGMTLVELVIAIVIIGIAGAALFSAMASITGRSADPMLRQQSLMLAEAYLEEILAQAYVDPGATATCGRACFDDVADYDGLNDKPPRDALDNVVTQLLEYRVQVRVTNDTLADGAATVPARYAEVRVTDPAGQELILGGYRGNY